MRGTVLALMLLACQFGPLAIPAASRRSDLSTKALANLERNHANAIANVEIYDHTGRFQRIYKNTESEPRGFWWNAQAGQYMVRLLRSDSMTSSNALTVWLVPQATPDTFGVGMIASEADVNAMLLDGATVSVDVDRPHGVVEVTWDGKWNGGSEEHPFAGKLISYIEWREGTPTTMPQAPPPQPTAAPVAAAQSIAGTWGWNADVMELQPNGTGRYTRNGTLCYEMTYSVAGDTLATSADRDSPCGARNETFRFLLNGTTLQLTHAVSGFRSVWQRR